jgi:uncharacterized protein RhaS with RHS repeats
MRARYYEPESSRFLSPDPRGARLRRPASLNPYQYAVQNPLRYVDPLGREETGLDGELEAPGPDFSAPTGSREAAGKFLPRSPSPEEVQTALRRYELWRQAYVEANNELTSHIYTSGDLWETEEFRRKLATAGKRLDQLREAENNLRDLDSRRFDGLITLQQAFMQADNELTVHIRTSGDLWETVEFRRLLARTGEILDLHRNRLGILLREGASSPPSPTYEVGIDDLFDQLGQSR